MSISICNPRKIDIYKHILLSSILVNNRVIVIGNKQKNFQLRLQLSTFENFQLQLQLQQNRVINYNFVNYDFSKPVCTRDGMLISAQVPLPKQRWKSVGSTGNVTNCRVTGRVEILRPAGQAG